ncbi:unnamed protein product [Mytilus coruscus]|uniref:Uncharacterized protein n=1 Tax=Mytilus coruscus TaxID=42192 RepID=A0A6J8APQ1_MYTCO|nr:unnamed protein product [Mytilus coruscus]
MDEPAMKQLIANEVQNAVQSSHNFMFSRIDTLMNNKIVSFESSMKESQKQLSDSQIAKIEELTTDNYEFGRKSNKKQHKINIKIIKKMKEAQSHLQDNPMQNEQINSGTKGISEVDPTDNNFAQLESSKRQEHSPKVKKDIIDSADIVMLYEKYTNSENIGVIRDLVMIC